MNEIKEIKRTLIVCCCIAFALLLVTTFLVKPIVVFGESMENNYMSGEYLWVNRIVYRFNEPQRGDVIVCRTDGHLIIKRVIATEYDEIEIRNGKTILNGKELSEPYIKEEMVGDFKKVVVPEEMVFVMGDNRNNSIDSRFIGSIPTKDIVGRVNTLQEEFGQKDSE